MACRVWGGGRERVEGGGPLSLCLFGNCAMVCNEHPDVGLECGSLRQHGIHMGPACSRRLISVVWVNVGMFLM